MKGKEKCKILKQIRQKIAEQNDIAYVTSECNHQGECLGTCPKCEQELRQLERELEKRQKAGKTIVVAGIAAALMVASVGCGANSPEAQTVQPSTTLETTTAGAPEDYTTLGLIDYTATELMGEPTQPLPTGEICSDPTEQMELLGEVPVEPLMGEVAFEDTQP